MGQIWIYGVFILGCIVTSTIAFPKPQDDGESKPLPSGEPPFFLQNLDKADPANEDTTPSEGVSNVEPEASSEAITAAPISEEPPTSGNDTTATEGPPSSPCFKGGAKARKIITDEDDECGPSCMLVNQTPIILLICILVLIILLLVLLFGCYFMKKLHGKAIFTTVQRPNRSDLEPAKG